MPLTASSAPELRNMDEEVHPSIDYRQTGMTFLPASHAAPASKLIHGRATERWQHENYEFGCGQGLLYFLQPEIARINLRLVGR